MRFASLGSGSKGNATLVQAEDTLLMIDCGFSIRETKRRLEILGLAPEQLTAILVTHEHSDHSAGVSALSRKYNIPVYLTHGTRVSGRCENCYSPQHVDLHRGFRIARIDVMPVAVPHDAKEPCQYRFSYRGKSLGVLTDLGSITPHVIDSYSGCDALVLEFNHDRKMLQAGVYPQHLKRRVGGDWGHLNNVQAAELLGQIEAEGLRHLVIAHISENNNHREHAERALLEVLSSLERVVWADQDCGFDWLSLD